MIDVYTSYAWEADSEAVLAKLERAFGAENLNLIYDKKSTSFKSSIKAFMDEIGCAQYIVVIISDKYLRSENCMYELLVIHENGNFERRIYPIVLPNAKIYKPTDIIDYKKYWDDRIHEIDEKLSGQSLSNINELIDESNKYSRIRSLIVKLTATLKDINSLEIKAHEADGFNDIIEKIKEDEISRISSQDDKELAHDDIHKFIQKKISDLNVYESTRKWLNKNQKKLAKDTINDLMQNKDKYNRRGLNTAKAIDTFKESILEHIAWMLYSLEYATTRKPISDHLKTVNYIYILPDAYKDFFQLMKNKIKAPTNNQLKHDEIAALIVLLNKLIDHYS